MTQSLPPWARDLRTYRHRCGMEIYLGRHSNGQQQWPVFQVVAGMAVLCCPRCGIRLKLDHCTEIGEFGETRNEEEPCLT